MADATPFPSLVPVIYQGILQSLREISEETACEKLAGYAILTDDDLTTIFGVATTTSYAEGLDLRLRYSAVEWPYGYKFDPFSNSRAALNASYEMHKDSSHAEHVERSFSSILSALQMLRNAGILDPDCLLYCGSTDPSDKMEALEIGSVLRLNSSVGIGNWEESHGPIVEGKF